MSKIPTPMLILVLQCRCGFFMGVWQKGEEMTKAQSLRKKDVAVLNKVFDKIRAGCSLYGSLSSVGLTSREFYQLMTECPKIKEDFMLALSDYADRCTDDIKALAESLKAGEIDNSTAKLLIETIKWLAQKACPEPISSFADDEAEKLSEIVVKFVG